ncbi:MAG: hypothetical protein NVV69_06715 [Methyloversatilis sp.]|jgi:hypothetical protein|uniref:hypothetical protein n=1 Tax=Methyloversatilis sp. TaxID=2569862 RepID=UPI0025F91B95|nr:hypothetical protein [Methyloversatilis sp.]MCR6665693.1 hypothetical protein [Methyloversatilis sp.]
MWRLVFIVLILVGVLVLKFAGGVLGKELTLLVAVLSFAMAGVIGVLKIPGHIKKSIKELNRPDI